MQKIQIYVKKKNKLAFYTRKTLPPVWLHWLSPAASARKANTHTHTPVCCCESMNLMMLPSAAKAREDSSSLDGSSKPSQSGRNGFFHRSSSTGQPLDAAIMPHGHETSFCGPLTCLQLKRRNVFDADYTATKPPGDGHWTRRPRHAQAGRGPQCQNRLLHTRKIRLDSHGVNVYTTVYFELSNGNESWKLNVENWKLKVETES